MSVTIVEVLRRAEQGMTRPFLCRGDDNMHIFAKLFPQWPLAFREQSEPWMQAALAKLPEIFQTMPPE